MKHSTRILTRRPRLTISLLVVTIATVLAATPALAFPPGPPPNDYDPFNPTDAIPSCDPSPSPDLNSPTGGTAETSKTCVEAGTPSLGPVTVTWVSDTVSGSATDDAWGQGDKSDCYLAKTGGVSGACVTRVYGIGAAKTDLQYHGIGLAKGANGDDYLYSGIKRLDAGGITSSNANYNVEINQLLDAYKPASPICGVDGPGTGGCNMWRSPGDLTFMTDWGGNQSSCNTATPAICAYVWIDNSGPDANDAGATCFNAKAPPCWGVLPGGDPALSANPDEAAGSINSGAATQPYTFSEIGVDLTESGLVPAGACKTFNDVWAHSRSSSSFTAELKDYIYGGVSLSTCSSTTTVLHERTDSSGSGDVQSGKEITVTVGAYVNDVATVTPTADASGNVNFRLYSTEDACKADTAGSGGTNVSTNALSSGSATSDTKQFTSPGDYWWRAFYLGDGLSKSASPCDEIVHVVQVNTAISTSPFYYPNDSAAVTAPNGGGTPTGSVKFRLFNTLANCSATTPSDTVGVGGLLYRQIVALPGASPFTVSTTNTTVSVSTSTTVYWLVEFVSTNPSQKGRNSICVENIAATLTGDSPGTAGNTP